MRSTDAFPSKYLKASEAKDEPLVGTISYAQQEEVGQEKTLKVVLYFEEERLKPMVLNRTNFVALEQAFGDSDDWPGHKTKIFCVPTSYQGKPMDGLRLQPIVPKKSAKEDLNDEIGF
jgi:hypothetical protein